MKICVILLLFLTVTNANDEEDLDFNHDKKIIHEKSGEEFHVKHHGRHNRIVFVEDLPNVDDVKCLHDSVRILTSTNHHMETRDWKEGMIIVGSDKWPGCKSKVDGDIQPGIYRKIERVLIGGKSTYVKTTNAGFADHFEDAHLTVKHKKGNWTGIPEAERDHFYQHRVKRAFLTERQVADMLTPLDIGYTYTGHKYGSNWNPITLAPRDQYTMTSENQLNAATSFNPNAVPNNQWRIHCKSCYFYYDADFKIEIKITKQTLDLFLMQFDGSIVYDQDFQAKLKGERSNRLLFQMREETANLIQLPIKTFGSPSTPDILLDMDVVSQIMMDVDLQFNTEAFLDIHLKETADMSVILRKELGSPAELTYTYTNTDRVTQVRSYDIQSEYNASTTMISKMIFKPVINWGWKYRVGIANAPPLFKLTLHDTAEFSVKQRVEFKGVENNAELTVCTRPFYSTELVISTQEIPLAFTNFGVHYWHDQITSSASEVYPLFNGTVNSTGLCSAEGCCKVLCAGPSELNADKTAEQTCGPLKRQITRAMNEFFTNMIQVKNQDILFVNEEHAYSWCGFLNYPCKDCRKEVAGYTKSTMCADRMMNRNMAQSMAALGKLVRLEWPRRKLRVKDAFSETTSEHSAGKYPWSDIHLEGRKAKIDVSVELTDDELAYTFNTMPAGDTSAAIINRLGQLAVCADFKWVKKGSDVVEVAEEADKAVAATNAHLKWWMEEGYAKVTIADCEAFKFKYPRLFRSKSYPSGSNQNYACGPIGDRMTRYNKKQFSKLFYYPFDDIEFTNEERDNAWCGYPGRDCIDCRQNNNSWTVDPEDRCADRIMTPRLGTRLRRLAKLVELKWGGAKKLIVKEAFDERHSTAAFLWGDYAGETSLAYEGRMARILISGTDLGVTTMGELTFLASCAGFDFVTWNAAPYANVLEVCVRKETPGRSFVVQFPAAQLLGVGAPFFSGYKYSWPGEQPFVSEPYKTILYDSSGILTVDLGGGFTPKDFKPAGERLFRLDPELVKCLVAVNSKVPADKKVKVKPEWGYLTQPMNLNNVAARHEEERVRHQLGQAVRVLLKTGTGKTDDWVTIAKTVASVCGNQMSPMDRGIGIGFHKDDLYFDLRPKNLTEGTKLYVKAWTHEGGTAAMLKTLNDHLKVIKGGPPIAVMDVPRACNFSDHIGGEKNFYIDVRTRNNTQRTECKTTKQTDFCKKTSKYREKVKNEIVNKLKKKAQLSSSSNRHVMKAINLCFKDACGPCMYNGPVWTWKVQYCLEVFNFYIEKAGKPFESLKDKLAFYNTENEDAINSTSVLACNPKSFVCVEKTEIYSIFAPAINARYKPNGNDSIEEELYSGDENPSPVMDILQQMVAMHASGNVSILVEGNIDLSSMHKYLKILMAYNKNVTEVKFYFSKNMTTFWRNMFLESFVRKAEGWAGSVCPSKARLALTPFTATNTTVLEKAQKPAGKRRKRELEIIQKEVDTRHSIHNWEIDWSIDKFGGY